MQYIISPLPDGDSLDFLVGQFTIEYIHLLVE